MSNKEPPIYQEGDEEQKIPPFTPLFLFSFCCVCVGCWYVFSYVTYQLYLLFESLWSCLNSPF